MALGAWLIVAANNAVFAHALGTLRTGHSAYGLELTFDGAAWAAGGVAISFFQAYFLSEMLHRQRKSAGELTGYLVGALGCICFSVVSMSAHILEKQRIHAPRTTVADAYRDVRGERDRLLREVSKLGEPRPADVIAQDLARADVPARVWKATAQCSRNTTQDDEHRRVCEPILKLYQERGNRARLSELEPLLHQARAQLGTIGEPPAALTEQEVGLLALRPWLLAGLLELIGSFGFGILRRGRKPKAAPPPAHVARAPIRSAVVGRAAEALLLKLADVAGSGAAGVAIEPDGSLSGPQEALAAACGVRSKATLNGHLRSLAAAGRVQMDTGPRGTRVRIIAPAAVTVH